MLLFYSIFDQVNAALVSIRDIQKHKILLINGIYVKHKMSKQLFSNLK